ncbi:hypothetical protein MMC25_007461 [Agyrium rufum]|nr:hypothetical protein [Agyrium rufum]
MPLLAELSTSVADSTPILRSKSRSPSPNSQGKVRNLLPTPLKITKTLPRPRRPSASAATQSYFQEKYRSPPPPPTVRIERHSPSPVTNNKSLPIPPTDPPAPKSGRLYSSFGNDSTIPEDAPPEYSETLPEEIILDERFDVVPDLNPSLFKQFTLHPEKLVSQFPISPITPTMAKKLRPDSTLISPRNPTFRRPSGNGLSPRHQYIRRPSNFSALNSPLPLASPTRYFVIDPHGSISNGSSSSSSYSSYSASSHYSTTSSSYSNRYGSSSKSSTSGSKSSQSSSLLHSRARGRTGSLIDYLTMSQLEDVWEMQDEYALSAVDVPFKLVLSPTSIVRYRNGSSLASEFRPGPLLEVHPALRKGSLAGVLAGVHANGNVGAGGLGPGAHVRSCSVSGMGMGSGSQLPGSSLQNTVC